MQNVQIRVHLLATSRSISSFNSITHNPLLCFILQDFRHLSTILVTMNTVLTTAIFLTALAAVGSSEELKASDVPQACTTICGPIVTLTNTCDINPDGTRRRLLRREADKDDGAPDDESDEAIEAQCICSNKSFNVGSVAALCAACLSQNRGETEGEFVQTHLASLPCQVTRLTKNFQI